MNRIKNGLINVFIISTGIATVLFTLLTERHGLNTVLNWYINISVVIILSIPIILLLIYSIKQIVWLFNNVKKTKNGTTK